MLKYLMLAITAFYLNPVIGFTKSSSGQSFLKMEDGIIFYSEIFSRNTKAVGLQVINDPIIWIIASASKIFNTRNSLLINNKQEAFLSWGLIRNNESLAFTIYPKFLTAVAELDKGAVLFYDAKGNKILAKKANNLILEKDGLEGGQSYSVSRHFETIADDARRGLRQHQRIITDKAKYLYFNNKPDKIIHYNGKIKIFCL